VGRDESRGFCQLRKPALAQLPQLSSEPDSFGPVSGDKSRVCCGQPLKTAM
jgi:hypothetical protein